jgi:ABC-type uncharacterized transport system substrate-binding protein
MKFQRFLRMFAMMVAFVITAWPLVGNSATRAPQTSELRILHIMSYHSPWRWTDRQFEAFRDELQGVKVSYEVFQMDAKLNSSREQKEKKAQEAMALIEKWKPDLVYTTDDDAQEYVARHYVNKSLPFVFSGVNNDPAKYGFVGSRNITGVMEHEHFAESVKLIRKIVPKAQKIALVFDDASMWDPVRARIMNAMQKLPGMTIVASDTIRTFAEYKIKMKEYEGIADIVGTLGIFNLKDADGKNVPYQDVQKWTVEHSKLPDFAFWIDRIYFGTLSAVTVSEREQGRAAGRLARAILVDGKSPSSLVMTPTTKGMPAISLARAKKLGIKLDADLLLTSEVIQYFDWNQP